MDSLFLVLAVYCRTQRKYYTVV